MKLIWVGQTVTVNKNRGKKRKTRQTMVVKMAKKRETRNYQPKLKPRTEELNVNSTKVKSWNNIGNTSKKNRKTNPKIQKIIHKITLLSIFSVHNIKLFALLT